MKNKWLLALSLALVIFGSTACSAAQAPWASTSGSIDAADTGTRLAAGTLLLEGSDLAVDVVSAAELLPLWKAVRSLDSSDVASQVEVQALYAQIEETLTGEQVQAIDAMDLGPEELASLMQEYAVQAGAQEAVPTDDGAAADRSSQGAGEPPDGGMPMGGGPDMGGAPVEMAGTSPAAVDGMTSESTAASSTVMTSIFVDPLIRLLVVRSAA